MSNKETSLKAGDKVIITLIATVKEVGVLENHICDLEVVPDDATTVLAVSHTEFRKVGLTGWLWGQWNQHKARKYWIKFHNRRLQR